MIKFQKNKKEKPFKKLICYRICFTLHESYAVYWWALPLAIFFIPTHEVFLAYRNSLKWSKKRAKKVLDRTLPQIVDYDEKDNSFSFNTKWNGTILYHHAPLHSKIWVRKFGFQLKNFLINEYIAEGYTKTVEDDWIVFREVQRGWSDNNA